MTDDQISELRLLLGRMPREPGTVLPPGATEEELDHCERVMGIPIPKELRDWIGICNAPVIGPGRFMGVDPAPEDDRIDVQLARHPEWLRCAWFPITGDSCGNTYVLDSRTMRSGKHPIYFLDHEADINTPCYIVSSSLDLFILLLLKHELDFQEGRKNPWPFNRSEALQLDPDLALFMGVAPMPWGN